MGKKDITERLLADYNDVFADICNVLLFNGREVVTPDGLQNAQTKSVYKADGEIHEQERDLLKSYGVNDILLAMIGFENQSQPDKYMPARVLSYDGGTYRSLLLEENPKLVPTLTLVLYFGLERWKYGTTLYETINVPDEWKPYVSDYKMNLFEIAFLDPEQVKMFKSDFRVVADYFVQKRINKNYTPSKRVIKHVDAVLKLLSIFAEDDRFAETVAMPDKRGGVSMETLFDYKEYKGMIRIYLQKMHYTPEKIVEALKEDDYNISSSDVRSIIQELNDEK